MNQSKSTMAQQIAQAAIAFEQRRTGHLPHSVTVVLSGETLVITLHGALSPAEKALARSPAGAAQVQEFHRELFNNSSAWSTTSCEPSRRPKWPRKSRGRRCRPRPWSTKPTSGWWT